MPLSLTMDQNDISGSGEGQEINRDMEEILWHHRESRW